MINKLQLAEIEEEQEQSKDIFKITDKASAEWALRKIAAHKAVIDENISIANAEHERISQWVLKENAKHQMDIEFFENALHEYMKQENLINPECRSIKLPHGTIRLRKMPQKWDFDDEKTINYLEQNYPEMIQIIKKYDKSKVKELVKNTGETWDGLRIEEQPDKFEVEVK